MDQNRRFAEMNGLLPYKSPAGYERYDYPDFSDPREVLKIVMEREDWPEFLIFLLDGDKESFYSKEIIENLLRDYILTPGKLRDAWIEWGEKQTEGGRDEHDRI